MTPVLMGVPALFRWLSGKYPKIVKSVIEETSTPNSLFDFSSANPNLEEFDNLYLDMNGIVHPCCHPEDKKAPETEEEMMVEIFKYTDRLLGMVRPRKVLFIAIDGVAPRAKLNQQRSRRFRSAKDAEEKAMRKAEAIEEMKCIWLVKLVKGLYSANDEEEVVFDVNCITPGTSFMKILSESLKYYISHRISWNPAWQNIKVVFSDSSVPGEGEHKIMDFIRNQRKNTGYDPNTRHVIYGLDADLIMLSLATHEPHFYVLREDVFFNNKRQDQCYKCGATGHYAVDCSLPESAAELKIKPFVFLSIPILREYLAIEFEQQRNSSDYDFERLIDDWIFLIFFVGNDFLPHLPSLEIREGAIDLLVGIYKRKFMSLGGYLTRDGKINFGRVITILSELGDIEESIFVRRQEREKRRLQNAAMRTQREKGSDAALENNRASAENRQLGSKRLLEETEIDDPIRFHEDGFKSRYYESKFGMKQSNELSTNVAKAYLEGLAWVLAYYYQGCASWNWFYPYHYSPFASDFCQLGDFKVDFDKGRPFKPFEQLLAVLPPGSRDHIPEAFHHLMTDASSELKDFYPEDFRIDLNGKKFAWQGVALLPFIDEKRLLAAAGKIYDKLNEEETILNLPGEELLFVSDSNNLGKVICQAYESSFDEILVDAKFNEGIFGRLTPYFQAKLHGDKICTNLPGQPEFVNKSACASFNCSISKEFIGKLLNGVLLPRRMLTQEDYEFVTFGSSRTSNYTPQYHSMHQEAAQRLANAEAAKRLISNGLGVSFSIPKEASASEDQKQEAHSPKKPKVESTESLHTISGSVFSRIHKRKVFDS